MARIAIISTNKYKYSETFIHMHVNELPGEVHLLHGGYLPRFAARGLTAPDTALLPELPPRSALTRLRGRSEADHQLLHQRRALTAYLQAQRMDVVLAEYGPSGVAVMDVCQQAGIPFLVHFHGYDAHRTDILSDQGRHYPEMFRKAAGLIVVSHHMKAALTALGAPTEKLHHIPYGVDIAAFPPTAGPAQPPYFLALGRLTPKKAPLLTLAAFSEVAAAVADVRLVLAGDGELQTACADWVAANGLGDRVEFRGAVAHAEVSALLQGASALVQHSVTTESGDAEGLPLAVLEAMATGIPVVATRHAGIPDAVTHGGEGWLSAEGDVTAMAAHLRQVLADPGAARAMGQAGRARVWADFQKARYLEDLVSLLHAVL